MQRVIYPGARRVAGVNGTKLDALITQGAVVARAYSVRQVFAAYAGQSCRLRGDGTGSPEADIPFSSGALDKSAAAALRTSGGGTTAFWKTWYDQSGNAVNATQSKAANQVRYGEGVFSTGALGDGTGAQTNCWMDIATVGVSQAFTVWSVCFFAATTVGRFILGTSASSTLGLTETVTSRIFAQNWGTAQSSGYAPSGKSTVAAVANGASSKLYANSTLRATGNAGSGGMTVGVRIGANSTPTTQNWFGANGNSITELIIFTGDPTGLAGWADFVADAKTYFGTA